MFVLGERDWHLAFWPFGWYTLVLSFAQLEVFFVFMSVISLVMSPDCTSEPSGLLQQLGSRISPAEANSDDKTYLHPPEPWIPI